MPKDLNEAIDALFKGLVFILYDYLATIWRIVVRPVRGLLTTSRRALTPQTRQIGPYVFAFLSFCVVLATPKYLNQVLIYYSDDYPGSSLSKTSLQDAYAQALTILSPSFLGVMVLTALLMCVAVDLLAGVLARITLRRPWTRRLYKTSQIYLTGVQGLLLLAALLVIFYGTKAGPSAASIPCAGTSWSSGCDRSWPQPSRWSMARNSRSASPSQV